MSDKPDYARLCLEERRAIGGGILEVHSKVAVDTKDDLARVYTPGVAAPCLEIAKDPEAAYVYTSKRNTVAVISDGSAVLGLGNIGPMAALPVMEGKSLLFKKFADLDAVPLVVDIHKVDELEAFVRAVAPTFGGINLEDISAPRCVELVERLGDLGIPLFHDDQDGTAVVLMAALHNAIKVTGRRLSDLKIVINGAGAAGYAIAKMLTHSPETPRQVLVCDSKGILGPHRELCYQKTKIMKMPAVTEGKGSLADAMVGADVFIGVSVAGAVTQDMVRSMAPDPMIFAMANPIPEIMPDLALEAGAAVVGTGRSDFPNQVNNALAFPGIFRGAMNARAKAITPRMMLAAAEALSELVPDPRADYILPPALEAGIAQHVGDAVAAAWREEEALLSLTTEAAETSPQVTRA